MPNVSKFGEEKRQPWAKMWEMDSWITMKPHCNMYASITRDLVSHCITRRPPQNLENVPCARHNKFGPVDQCELRHTLWRGHFWIFLWEPIGLSLISVAAELDPRSCCWGRSGLKTSLSKRFARRYIVTFAPGL